MIRLLASGTILPPCARHLSASARAPPFLPRSASVARLLLLHRVRSTNNVVTYAFGEGANSTGRWRPIGPYAMAKVFTAPGSVTSIIRDGSRQATYFVSVATPLNIGGGRIYEINPEAPLRFKGQDITANLPATLVGQVGAWVRWVELGRWGG